MSVALLEIAVGMLVVAGLLTRLAAAVGLGLNLLLFLTNSWHTSPYFLGSDIVFVFAWLPFVLTGATGQPAIDHALDRWAAHGAPWLRLGGELATRWEADLAGTRATRARRVATSSGRAGAGSRLTRRGVIAQALGLAGLGALTIGGLSALAKGAYRARASARADRRPPSIAPPDRVDEVARELRLPRTHPCLRGRYPSAPRARSQPDSPPPTRTPRMASLTS